MAAKTARRHQLRPEERAERVEALHAEFNAAVEALASSEAWRRMLVVASRCTHYSFTNRMILWAQAEERGVMISRVAAYGTWKSLGYRVTAGSKSFRIFQPIYRRLTAEEVRQWLAEGHRPYDSDGKPKTVVRGYRAGAVFDVSQVEPTAEAQPLPEPKSWVPQQGSGPMGLWGALTGILEARGYDLEVRPSISTDGGAHGWTSFSRRLVWVNSDCGDAERIRILAHELAHVLCDHGGRDVSRAQGETEADSVAYIVCATAGLDIASSSVEYVADWSGGDSHILHVAAETVHQVAGAIVGDLVDVEAVGDTN